MKNYIKPEIETTRLELADCIALGSGDSLNDTVGNGGTYTKGGNDWETEDNSAFDW